MLCAVSSVATELTSRALQQSCKGIRFGDVALLSDRDPHFPVGSDIRWICINRLTSKEAYSSFLLKELVQHVTLPHVLVVQWDGYVENPLRWRPEFLDYDYVGAVWPQFNDEMVVGNGGFSLRSLKLLRALQSEEFSVEHPEDVAICRTFRRSLERGYGVRFAPHSVASAFSCERDGIVSEAFGFHGAFNLPGILPSEDLEGVISLIPDAALTGRDGADLIIQISRSGLLSLALRTFRRRFRAMGSLAGNFILAFAIAKESIKEKWNRI